MTSIIKSFLWRRKLALIIMIVITANVYATHGQSYLLAVGPNSQGYFKRQLIFDPFRNNSATPQQTNQNFLGSDYVSTEEEDDRNSTLIVIKSTLHPQNSDLSQTAMDVITIIWYVATFFALAAFFMLMACSDRRCNARQRAAAAAAARRNETPNPPPTPSPSYSEFAPPSYESVMNLENAPTIYVIPFPMEEQKEESNVESQSNPQTAPAVTFYMVNELEKLGS